MHPPLSFCNSARLAINSETFSFSDNGSINGGSISGVVPGSDRNDAVSSSVDTFFVIVVFAFDVLI